MPATTKSRGAKKKAAIAPAAKGNTQLQEFFIESLKDIYWAEKRLTKALPKLQKAATTQELKAAIEEHLSQTQEHVSRIEEAFQMMGKKAQAKKCEAMEGLVKEGESILEETEKGSMTRDAGIISAAQKVEHYEIATYGTLVTLAKTMGEEDVAQLLAQTLEEEKQTDETLTSIAEGGINWEAEQEEEEEGEEGEGEEGEEEEEQ
ncbi:MAG: ferritin-like domain-containing protein [Niastella sp.]|uniref:YciE/YciF ferroxidase family protein n=1 Tax=Niastella sp. TaxID=1869183 RepID=UPI00389A105F